MERFHIDTSETDVQLDVLLLKKKIKRFKSDVLIMLTLIILATLFSIVVVTILMRLKQHDHVIEMEEMMNKVLYPCHDNGGNQEWQFTVDEELKNRQSCLIFTKNTSLNGVQVTFDECNGSASQKCKFISGTLRSTEYDVCIQTERNGTFAVNCNSAISTQIFERKLLYRIDQICTFKQGPHVLLNTNKVIVANNGHLVHNTLCLESTLSWKNCDKNWNENKWEYTDDGHIKNNFKNACVEKYDNGTVALNTCDLSSKSQNWICDHESV